MTAQFLFKMESIYFPSLIYPTECKEKESEREPLYFFCILRRKKRTPGTHVHCVSPEAKWPTVLQQRKNWSRENKLNKSKWDFTFTRTLSPTLSKLSLRLDSICKAMRKFPYISLPMALLFSESLFFNTEEEQAVLLVVQFLINFFLHPIL
jgi:hypothetical protein